MNLAELFPESRCVVPLVAPTIADAALQLAQVLENQGLLAHHERLIERIEEARAEDIIGLADRAFILHYRTDAARDFAAAIGVTPKPLRRDLGDSDEFQIARVVALIVSPRKLAAKNLQFVGSLARFLANPARVAPIVEATSAHTASRLRTVGHSCRAYGARPDDNRPANDCTRNPHSRGSARYGAFGSR